MIDLKEILIANGIAMLMMWFLLICRRKNRENIRIKDKIYDGMAFINLMGAFFETITFLVDGKVFMGSYLINCISNSLCFIGTVSIGFLWCIYVDLRVFRNTKKTSYKMKFLIIPWLVEIMTVLLNCIHSGILFKISQQNVYQRSNGALLGYATLIFYFAYSVYVVYNSRKQGIQLNYFPILFFVGPCLGGVLIQLFIYGITSSWISVALALTFVQMQAYAENSYVDELSGLYNRRYLNRLLAKKETMDKTSIYGIMMDINDFKSINDHFGHSVGDHAICVMGNLLCQSVPDNGVVIRYAGDEFIVLLLDVDHECALLAMDTIRENLLNFNKSGEEPFSLSAAMGYTKFEYTDNAETFLMHMDKKMYEEKRKYHQLNPVENKLYK